MKTVKALFALAASLFLTVQTGVFIFHGDYLLGFFAWFLSIFFSGYVWRVFAEGMDN